MTRRPAVELLYWEGCPSHPDALVQLRRILEEEHVDANVELVEVLSDEQAQRDRFPGSPTIRIDGEDVAPSANGEPFSLTCRIYRTRDGRVSAIPDPEDIRAAVRRVK
jgi:hypothetical protein